MDSQFQANISQTSTNSLPELQSLLAQPSISIYPQTYDSFDSQPLPAAYNFLFGTNQESLSQALANYQPCSLQPQSLWDCYDVGFPSQLNSQLPTTCPSQQSAETATDADSTKSEPKSPEKEGTKVEEPPEKKSASDRERSRMRQMNTAFDSLRKILDHKRPPGKRLSKIQALRFAIQYMIELEDFLLDSPDQTSEAGSSNGYTADFNPWPNQMYQQTLDFGDQQQSCQQQMFTGYEESQNFGTTPTLRTYLDSIVNEYPKSTSSDLAPSPQHNNYSM